MRGKEYGPIQSCGVCLDHHGHLLQEHAGLLGLRPSLCRCGDLVIGTDRVVESWRLWNWAAAQEANPYTVLSLDPLCQRSYVSAQEGADWFWLIEELPKAVRVSKWEASSLTQMAAIGELAGYHLLPNRDYALYPPNARPLEEHRNLGLIPYQNTLLLLVLNTQGEMELYQAQ
jgi:hypothetical protein